MTARGPCYTDPVANLTITVDAELLKRARIRALERGESVNSYLAEALRRYVANQPQQDVVARLLSIAESAKAGSSGSGRAWTRDELHRH